MHRSWPRLPPTPSDGSFSASLRQFPQLYVLARTQRNAQRTLWTSQNSLYAALSSLVLQQPLSPWTLSSGSLAREPTWFHPDFSSVRGLDSLKAVSWSNRMTPLICSLSLGDHCSLCHDAQCLRNRCFIFYQVFFIVSGESRCPQQKLLYQCLIDTKKILQKHF